MDRDIVTRIARAHRALEGTVVTADPNRDTLQQRTEAEDARDLWIQLGRECAHYCEYYNSAMGAGRIFCEIHDDTIVVRSHQDLQNAVTLSRTPGAFHAGMVLAHRYRYPGRAANVSIPINRSGDRGFTLSLEGHELSPNDFVLELLERYTEELVTDA